MSVEVLGGYNFCIMMHWYEWVTWVANIALVLVGGGGILVAVCTLKKIERQTKATEDQARYLTTSERAWIIVSSRFPAELHPGDQETITRFRWDMKNVGKSPARLLEFNGVVSKAERSIPFPDPPRFFGSPHPLNKLLLVPSDSWGITWVIEGDPLLAEEVDAVKTAKDPMMISYGYIKYLDIFEKEHTTRFCQIYWVDPRTKSKMFLPYIEAPSSYTHCD
jgi:hypothetical protein